MCLYCILEMVHIFFTTSLLNYIVSVTFVFVVVAASLRLYAGKHVLCTCNLQLPSRMLRQQQKTGEDEDLLLQTPGF